MAEITKEDLLNEEALQGKLEAYREQIKELKKQQDELIDKQSEVFKKKIEEFTPVMKFMRENRMNFNHPTLKVHSNLGAVLDYDSNQNEVYVYDVEEGGVKKINIYNHETKYLPAIAFIQNRSLENAIAGLNYLLTFQEEVIREFSKDLESRQRWIDENI